MKYSTNAPHHFAKFHCSIARALAQIEPPWAPLILRDVFFGLDRFEELHRDLGIPSSTLSKRLESLVEKDVLQRIPYREHPPRHAYRPTEKGTELFPILLALLRWGDAWASQPEGHPVQLRHLVCGRATNAKIVCETCSVLLRLADVRVHAGPGARIARGSTLLAAQLQPDPTAPPPETADPHTDAPPPVRELPRLRERFGPTVPVAADPANDVHYPKPSRTGPTPARRERELPRIINASEPRNDVAPQIKSNE